MVQHKIIIDVIRWELEDIQQAIESSDGIIDKAIERLGSECQFCFEKSPFNKVVVAQLNSDLE